MKARPIAIIVACALAACPREAGNEARSHASDEPSVLVTEAHLCTDGTRPLLIPRAEGNPDFDLFLVCLDGGTARFTSSSGSELHGAWSPDGRRVTYVQNRVATVAGERTSTFDLVTVDDAGDDPRVLVAESPLLGFPTWSPDGRRIAFSEGLTNTQISIVDVASGHVHRVGRGVAPDWSPEGSLFAFVGFDPGGDQAIFSMSVDGSRVRRLTGGTGDDLDPKWSPNGGWIAFHRAKGLTDDDIWRIRPDGHGLERVTSNAEGPLSGPTWISDRLIAYILYAEDGQYVIAVESDTGREMSRARLSDI